MESAPVITHAVCRESMSFVVDGETYTYDIPYLYDTADFATAAGEKCHRAEFEFELEHREKTAMKGKSSFSQL